LAAAAAVVAVLLAVDKPVLGNAEEAPF